MTTFLAWSPIILLAVLAVVFRRSALDLAVAGLLWTCFLAVAIFSTPVKVVALAALDGLVTTFPLLLVVYGGILLASLLLSTGSLARIAEWFSLATRTRWQKTALLSLGMANALEGAGIVAEPVAAPMLRAAGLSPTTSAALSIIGYSGLMTLGMGGVIITVLANVSGYPLPDLVYQVAILSVPASVFLACSIPWYEKENQVGIKIILRFAFLGAAAGAAAFLAAVLVAYQVGELAGGAALILLIIGPRLTRLKSAGPVLRDLLPIAVMGIGIVTVNTIPGIKGLAQTGLAFPVSVIDGRIITIRPLSDAYIYLFLAFVISHRLLAREKSLTRSLATWTVGGFRTLTAMALFGAMGQILAFTGLTQPRIAAMDASHNIPVILSATLAGLGSAYPIFVPFLGWIGTFLTGYGVASIMLFAPLQAQIAGGLGLSPVLLVSGLAVGASLGSVSSPFKVAFAASMTGAAGREGDILRVTIPLGIAVCLGLGVVMWLMI